MADQPRAANGAPRQRLIDDLICRHCFLMVRHAGGGLVESLRTAIRCTWGKR